MDKVIDGVDVSECDNLAILQNRMIDKEFTFCNAYQEDCSERENCYYKQLKRLQAENEKLKQVANDSIIEQEKLIAKVNELQAENERLKEEQERQRDYIVNYKNYKYEQEQKYRQALQEIREIVEGCQYGDCHECKYKPIDDCRTQLIVNVIDKINEVIGAE